MNFSAEIYEIGINLFKMIMVCENFYGCQKFLLKFLETELISMVDCEIDY